MADVARYRDKHNEANGENNADGHGHNLSDNCGVEGDTDDPAILARRARRMRNLLATVFMSQGAPMLLAGDEMGRSQRSNNNSYCQDNALSWIDWAGADTDLLAFTRRLIALHRDNPVLRQGRYLHGGLREDGFQDVAWSGLEGGALNWRDPMLNVSCLMVRGAADDPFSPEGAALIVVNGGDQDRRLALPEIGPGARWIRALDTASPDASPTVVSSQARLHAAAHSVAL